MIFYFRFIYIKIFINDYLRKISRYILYKHFIEFILKNIKKVFIKNGNYFANNLIYGDILLILLYRLFKIIKNKFHDKGFT